MSTLLQPRTAPTRAGACLEGGWLCLADRTGALTWVKAPYRVQAMCAYWDWWHADAAITLYDRSYRKSRLMIEFGTVYTDLYGTYMLLELSAANGRVLRATTHRDDSSCVATFQRWRPVESFLRSLPRRTPTFSAGVR